MVPLAHGTDGGGSIRIPAACCGLVGLKPSRGRISRGPEQGDDFLVQDGVLTRTVAETAELLDVLAGYETGDATWAPPPVEPFATSAAREPGRLRIAMTTVPPIEAAIDPVCAQAVSDAALLLESLGHEVIERNPAYGMTQLDFVQMWWRGIYEESLGVPDRSQLELLTRQMAWAGKTLVPERRRAKLLVKRVDTTARILTLWNEVDVLMTPGLAKTAIAAEGGYGKPMPLAIDIAGRFTPFTSIFNLTGQPAISVPCGLDPGGMPIGLQLAGKMWDERGVLRAARAYEMVRGAFPKPARYA
jgi:amidase